MSLCGGAATCDTVGDVVTLPRGGAAVNWRTIPIKATDVTKQTIQHSKTADWSPRFLRKWCVGVVSWQQQLNGFCSKQGPQFLQQMRHVHRIGQFII